MQIDLQAVRIAAGEEGTGLLVFTDGWLVAILVRLGAAHGNDEGHLYLETGYGRFSDGEKPIFIDEAAARAWFDSSLADKHMTDPWRS